MHDSVNRRLSFICFPQAVDHTPGHAVGHGKLFKVQREHFEHIHVSNRRRSNIFQINAEKGTAENVPIAALVHEEFDGSNELFALLYFIKKDQRLTGDQRLICERRNTKQEICAAFCVFKQRSCRAIFQKVDFNERFKISFANFPDDVGLADLTCTGDQQSLFVLFIKLADAVFDFSFDHMAPPHEMLRTA